MRDKSTAALTGKLNDRRRGLTIPVALAALAMMSSACSSPQQKLERYMKSGAEYLEAGKLGLANVQFQNALKIQDDNVPALLGLAKIAERRSNYEQMFGILQRVIRVDPNNMSARLDLAKLYLLGDDTARALDEVDAVLAAEPKNAAALAAKAAVMIRVQNKSAAVELANAALAIDPTLQEAVAVLASERAASEDYEGALAILDKALAADPKAAVLHILRVQVLTQLGREGDVVEAYKRLIAEFPDDAGYRRLYATALIGKDRLEDARSELMEVTRIAPKDRQAKLDVVRIDYRIGGKAKAEETFKKLIEDSGNDVDLLLAYGAFLREEKDYAGADAAYHVILRKKGADVSEMLRAKNELAALKLLEGKRDQAEKILSEILAADADDPDALVKRAGLKVADGQLDEAIADLRVVTNSHPDSIAARLLMASAFEQKGDMNFAESEYVQAVQLSNRGEQPSNLFAKFLLRRGDADRAERVLSESVVAHPGSEENLKMLAGLRLYKQDWRGAEEAANSLRAANAQDEDVGRILAAAYSGLKDYAGAIEILTKEQDRSPLSARPLATLIQAYVSAGRYDDAERFLRDTVDKNPAFYEAHVLLAQLQRVERRTDEAVTTLEKAIALDPLRTEAYEALYGVNVFAGRREEAGRVIEQALAAAPDSDGLQLLKADHLIAVGDNDGAIAIYETILTRRPEDLIVANNLASLLSDRQDEASLARAVEAARALKDSDNPYFLDTYGWAMYRGGRAAEGVAALEKAAAAAPALADARYHLGVALIDSGETARGRSELEAAIAAPGADPRIVAAARRKLDGSKQ